MGGEGFSLLGSSCKILDHSLVVLWVRPCFVKQDLLYIYHKWGKLDHTGDYSGNSLVHSCLLANIILYCLDLIEQLGRVENSQRVSHMWCDRLCCCNTPLDSCARIKCNNHKFVRKPHWNRDLQTCSGTLRGKLLHFDYLQIQTQKFWNDMCFLVLWCFLKEIIS